MAPTGTDTLNSRPTRPDTEVAGLVASVVRRTARHVAATADKDRKAIAQVFTPASVAGFMAAQASRFGDPFRLGAAHAKREGVTFRVIPFQMTMP